MKYGYQMKPRDARSHKKSKIIHFFEMRGQELPKNAKIGQIWPLFENYGKTAQAKILKLKI